MTASTAAPSAKARTICRGLNCTCAKYLPGPTVANWVQCANCQHVRETHRLEAAAS